MELRSSRKRNEYKELQITLKGMGFYEDGMDLQEMRHILDALNQSVSQRETDIFDDDDMERALRESEMDFMPGGGPWNSTMMGQFQASSPCSSPEMPAQVLIVQAEVHHSLDWSPQRSEEERLNRKRSATDLTNNDEILSCSNSCKALKESDSKGNQQHNGLLKRIQSFLSNRSSHNENSSLRSSLSPTRNESNDNDSPIQVVGPISMRGPSNDSGVISAHESNKLLTTTTEEMEQNSPDTTLSSSNTSTSSSGSHDIVGPVSVRRPIHDSGVGAITDNEAVISTSWDFNTADENSMEVGEDFRSTYDEEYDQSEPSL
ncbi:uncharacterized protein LOC142224358 [Haematobia irritans]|uniref:uncharacterized protein LOC142224358 n=1 Tax=Haematobia irritans TaxID=7368 RepID=UPI003F4FE90A